jgi:Icc-related predicted phosphoesterase
LREVRIVAVADTHLFHHELVVPEGDVLVHAGDLCRGGSIEELRAATEWLRTLPHPVKIVVAGNHDTCLERTADTARSVVNGEGIDYLEDSGIERDGVRFWGSPWQPEYNGWAFNLPRGKPLADKWAKMPPAVDVLITHGPPMGFGDGSSIGAARAGCRDLRVRVAEVRPLVHLFGHIHEDGGAWTHEGTVFAYVTTWECERPPTVLDLDVRPRLVTLVTVPPPRRP